LATDINTWSDNKVRELATMCLPWQYWTKALVWFDDDISAFHSFVVVIYGSLFLSGICYCLHAFWCATAKQRRVTICQDLLERQDDILGHVITGDETWVYQYNPETKQQSAQWKTANSLPPKISVSPNRESKQF